jgi:dihydroorotase
MPNSAEGTREVKRVFQERILRSTHLTSPSWGEPTREENQHVMLDLLIKDGTLVTSKGRFRADLGIQDGKVVAIGTGLGQADQEINAASLHVLPGLVDVHVHFREPGMEYKEDFTSGSMAAAAGGVTTVFDMPNTLPPTSTGRALGQKRERALGRSHVDFGLYGVILPDNEEELGGLASEGAMGFKLFMGETTGKNPPPDDGVIFAAFRRAAELGLVVGVHAENDPVLQRLKSELKEAGRTDPRAHLDSRPAFVEAEAVSRAVTLAEAAGNRLHVHHVSTRQGIEQVIEAKRRGVPVSCEVLISHLLLDETAYERYGNLIQLNPPIRPREHVERLWAALTEGHVDCVATDHAPHSLEEQSSCNVWESVGGFIGVETLLPLLLDCVSKGRMSLERAVQASSENPARLYGLYPRKGSLEIGADADFVLVDMNSSYRLSSEDLHSKHPVTPYHGWLVRGRPLATYLRGRCVAREGEVTSPPTGRMLSPDYGRGGGE